MKEYTKARNNMKEKNGKPARPKFHVYFSDKVFTSADEYTQHKQKVCDYFTAFDPNAKDAARFFYGVENPQVEYFEGKTLLYNYMQTVKIDRTDSTSAMQDKPTTHKEKRITKKLIIGVLLFALSSAIFPFGSWRVIQLDIAQVNTGF